MKAFVRTTYAPAALGGLALMATAPTYALAQDNRAAYDVAVRCFVANVHAEGLRRDAGQTAAADRYRLSGRQSFDAAVALGTAIGKTRAQMEADIHRSQQQDLPRMVRDAAYFGSVVSACRAYGLMPTA